MQVKTSYPEHIKPILDNIDKQISQLEEQLIPKTATESAYLQNGGRRAIQYSILELIKKRADIERRYITYSFILTPEEHKNLFKTDSL